MAPVAGRVADREQDRPVLLAGAGQRLLAPRVPVDRVVPVLEQVRAGLAREAVGHRTQPTFRPSRVSESGPDRVKSRRDLAFQCGRTTVLDAWGPDSRPSEPSIEAVLAEARRRGPRDRARGALRRAEKTEAELRYLADHDSLTGLLDRRRFRSELDQLRLLQRPLRRPGRGDDHRHRRPQGGQRQPRPPRRRQPDPPDRQDPARKGAGHRHRRPPLGRRARGADAADRHRGRRSSSARTCAARSPRAPADAGGRPGDDQRRHRDVRRRRARRRRGGPGRRRPGDVPGQGGGPQPDRRSSSEPGRDASRRDRRPDDQRRGSATRSPTTASASTASRSTASPPAASSATSCCCG